MNLVETMARAMCRRACLRIAGCPEADTECLADGAACDSWAAETDIAKAALKAAEEAGWVLVPKKPTA